MLIADILSRD